MLKLRKSKAFRKEIKFRQILLIKNQNLSREEKQPSTKIPSFSLKVNQEKILVKI